MEYVNYIKNLCTPSKVYLTVSITIFIFNSIFNSNKKQTINIIIPLIIRLFIITYLINYVCEKYGTMNSWYFIILLAFFPIFLLILLDTYCKIYKYDKKCKTMFNVINFLF
jgi:hypothetical protein